MHGLGWRMPAATMKLNKLNYKGTLDVFYLKMF